MAKSALVAVATEIKQTEIKQILLPNVEKDTGILKVEIVGVCGTDVSYYEKIKEPMILGHHVVGYIDEIGELASKRWGVKEGDRVVMEEYIPCGQCELCRKGLYRLCSNTNPRENGIRYGATPIATKPYLYGGFSQYMYLHSNAVLHKLPSYVPAIEGALTLPIANGFEWMRIIGDVGPGSVVVIQGPGQQGLACALAAKASGAEIVIMTGRNSSSERLKLGLELGADYTINVSHENLINKVDEITKGKMADLVIDVTSGGTEPVVASLEVAKIGGTVLLGAAKYQRFNDIDLDIIYNKMLTIKGVRGHSYQSVQMAVDFISSGKFPLSIMNSHNFKLSETDLALRTAAGETDLSRLLVTVSPWL